MVTDETRSSGFGAVARKPNIFPEIIDDDHFFPLKKLSTDF